MRPPFRLPAKIGVAAVLAGLAGVALPLAGEAASGVSLTVHAGYQDVVKPGEWMPVTIDARNNGASVDGTLQVQESLNAQPGVSGFTVYQEPLSLASGASKRVRVYVEMDTTGATVRVRLLRNNRVIASQDSLAGSTASDLIGVLSDQPTTLDDLAAVHPASVAARVVHLRSEDLADSAIPLRAFDILAIDDFASDGLTTAQRTALSDFVNAGGSLLIGTGAAWHKTLAGISTTLLPMDVSGTTVVDSSAVGASATELATGTGLGDVWLADGARPLLIDRAVGAGTVTMATFDWNQAPLAITSTRTTVLRQLLSRAIFGAGGGGQNLSNIGGPGFGPVAGTGQSSIASRSGALTQSLGNLPGLDLPSFQLTALLVILYVLIVGPVNYLVLGALRRRALAWVTVPLIALVAAGGAYGAGVITKGRSVQLNQVAIVHSQPGWQRAYQETYTGVIPPSRGNYQAIVNGDRVLISPITNGYGPGLSNSSLQVDLPNNGVTLSGMTAFSLGGFATEGITNAPALSGSLKLVNGALVGTIENHSSLSFSEAVLIAGDAYQKFGALNPGATATVNLVPKPANAFGQPLYTRIYSNAQFGGPQSYAYISDRESTAKSQILSLLPSGGNFKGYAGSVSPVLVAWTHQPLQAVTVNGSHPRSTSLTAVALSLGVDQIGTGSLPAGIVNSRIVDVVGDSQGSGPPGMLILQNGTVTFEFAPTLTPGSHLSGAAISSQNPYSAKFVGPPGTTGSSQGVNGQVWDWASSSWVDINYQDNGTTALPDSAINPSSGVIRVRIGANNAGFVAGSLTLAGTVK